jgi:VIT1/CCC1 family predicted Fe2+/Mn2+ transporter
MAGLITGISATLSMAASGYLSSREAGQKDAVKSAAYTGLAYLVTVALLIIPYLILQSNRYLWALGITLLIAVAIIACFNFYVSVAKGRPFRRNFFVMVGISMGVAVISFVVGLIVKNVLGIDL